MRPLIRVSLRRVLSKGWEEIGVFERWGRERGRMGDRGVIDA